MTPNVMLIYKLLTLENARQTLDQRLRNFTNRAHEEVQLFLNVSLQTNQYNDLSRSLDAKCLTLKKILNSLPDVTQLKCCDVDPPFRVKASEDKGDITNQLHPFPDKIVLTTDVLKFGPILGNVLLASSITKTIQVLGAALSLRLLRRLLDPQAVNNDVFRGVEPSQNTDAGATRRSADFQIVENELVMFEEKPRVGSEGEPALIDQCQKGSQEVLPAEPTARELLAPHPASVVVNAPLALRGLETNAPARNHKQTAAQLLDFLRTGPPKQGATQAASPGLSGQLLLNASSPTTAAPPPSAASDDGAGDGVGVGVGGSDGEGAARVEASPPVEKAAGDEDARPPVFRVKRVGSEGAVVYSCVVVTDTELWDVGEVVKRDETPDAVEQVETERRQNKESNRDGEACAKDLGEPPQSPQFTHNTCGAAATQTTALSAHVSVPEFEFSVFKEMEVVVSHVVTPGNFYIQCPGGMAKQQALVKDWRGRLFAEENSVPDIGTLVMAFSSEQKRWCRARVLKICGVGGAGDDGGGGVPRGSVTSVSVEVLRLDYGDTARLSLRNVAYLTPDMAALPLQAVRVSLANVSPVEGQCWTEEAVAWFRAMAENRTLYARLYPSGSTVTVQLFLERGKMGVMRRGASLSLRLAQSGHAKHDQMKAVGGVKRGNCRVQRKRQEEAAWQNYLISCYTGRKL